MRTRAVLIALTFVLAACASDPAESAFPGEIGAPCATRADCNEGLLCALDYDEALDYSDCFMPCSGEGGTCPAGSFCAYAASGANDPYPWVCRRECTDDAGCAELHPDATACKEFTGNPAGKKSCGIKG